MRAAEIFRQMSVAAIVSFILLPTCIFVHELGHYSVARTYGWRAKMFPAYVSFHYDKEQPTSARVMFLIAGPAIDFLQIAAGLSILVLVSQRIGKARGLLYWVGVTLAGCSLKWAVTPLIALYVPASDELQISTVVGWYPMLLPVLVMLPGVAVVTHVTRQHLKHGTLFELLCVPLSGFLGAGAWTQLIGPQIFN